VELENIVPWGRSLKEYALIFDLTSEDFKKEILGCGDGPASFNAELTAQNGHVISVDPIYQFDGNEIKSRIDAIYPEVMSQVQQNAGDFIWDSIKSPEELGETRMAAMSLFLSDYGKGKETGRYINASLPSLPFGDNSFDLALCSHYLFLYSTHVDLEQHLLSIRALCRVAREVRVYPLVTLEGDISIHLDNVTKALLDEGIQVYLRSVKYRFQKGATEMLVAKKV